METLKKKNVVATIIYLVVLCMIYLMEDCPIGNWMFGLAILVLVVIQVCCYKKCNKE